MPETNLKWLTRNPALLALAAWLVPGAGYWLVGERWRGWVVGSCVTLCFWTGLLIGGAVNVIDWGEQRLWYFAQLVTGVHLLLGEILARLSDHPSTGGKSMDLGLVFTGVAGLLNLVAILDTLGRAFPSSLMEVASPTPPTDPSASPHKRR